MGSISGSEVDRGCETETVSVQLGERVHPRPTGWPPEAEGGVRVGLRRLRSVSISARIRRSSARESIQEHRPRVRRGVVGLVAADPGGTAALVLRSDREGAPVAVERDAGAEHIFRSRVGRLDVGPLTRARAPALRGDRHTLRCHARRRQCRPACHRRSRATRTCCPRGRGRRSPRRAR